MNPNNPTADGLCALLNEPEPTAETYPDTVAADEAREAPSSKLSCVERERRNELIDLAVSQLPPRCREAFRLRIIEERPYEEIALRVGVDAQTARRFVARALAHCYHVIKRGESVPA